MGTPIQPSSSTPYTNQDVLDYLFRISGYGSRTSAASSSLLGFNHRGVGAPQPTNTDVNGMVFFTRPNLNLTYNNLQADRRMMPLAAQDAASYLRTIRNQLDPENELNIQGAFSDPNNPFITMLTNNCISATGWPDPYAGTYTTKEGKFKEVQSMMDGAPKDYSAYQVTTTFRNLQGDPISLLIYYWIIYGLHVTVGSMMPWPFSMIRNEIDYNTRIYYFVMDRSRRYIQKSYNCGAAFPVGTPLGQAGNFDASVPFNLANATLPIQWQCDGVEINDPIAFEDFNRTVQQFNASMADGTRTTAYTQLKTNQQLMAGNANVPCYPWIDLDTNELQWWVRPADFNAITTNPMDSGVPPVSNTQTYTPTGPQSGLQV
jgi:hypothetical protein